MRNDIKIGVFLCECGGKISANIDLKAVGQMIENKPGVAHVDIQRYLGLAPGIEKMKYAVEKEKLNRVVIGSCSQRVMKKRFVDSWSSRKPVSS